MATLRGTARDWFKQIALGSITSFFGLRQVFLDTYMIISKRQNKPTNLASVHQGLDESLRDYISRFNNIHARCDKATTHNASWGDLPKATSISI